MSAGDSVVSNVQRGMATVQEYGTDAELLLSVFVHKKTINCKLFLFTKNNKQFFVHDKQ